MLSKLYYIVKILQHYGSTQTAHLYLVQPFNSRSLAVLKDCTGINLLEYYRHERCIAQLSCPFFAKAKYMDNVNNHLFLILDHYQMGNAINIINSLKEYSFADRTNVSISPFFYLVYLDYFHSVCINICSPNRSLPSRNAQSPLRSSRH